MVQVASVSACAAESAYSRTVTHSCRRLRGYLARLLISMPGRRMLIELCLLEREQQLPQVIVKPWFKLGWQRRRAALHVERREIRSDDATGSV